MDNFETPALFT